MLLTGIFAFDVVGCVVCCVINQILVILVLLTEY